MLTRAEVLARYPELEPLLDLDPPWRFYPLIGALTGERATLSHVEALWIVDEENAGVVRRTATGWTGPPVSEVDFAGPLADAVRLLLLPERRWHS